HHTIQTTYAAYEFDRREEWVKVVSSGFAALLVCLGTPRGVKSRQSYDVPAWLEAAPLWHKRLFLAGLFGAELSSPATVTDHETVFAAPTLSMNKRSEHVPSGRKFLHQLSSWLSQCGVETQGLPTREEQINADGERSIRLKLILASATDNL